MKCMSTLIVGAALIATASAQGGTTVIDFEDLDEDFYGTEFSHQGITYSQVNQESGVFPDGETFEAPDPADVVLVEDATLFYQDYPDWGSANKTLSFGSAFIPGENLSVGRISSVTMDLDAPAESLSMDIAYYENGPWGGIEFHLDAISDGAVVASDSIVISDLGGRDNITTDVLAIDGATFDQLQLYATYGNDFSLPRIMIDDITITHAAASCAADLTGDDQVNVFDLLDLLGAWGACEGCPADLTGDDTVNVFDLLELLGAWGACE